MLTLTVENAAHLREAADAAAGDPAGRVCVVDLYLGEEPVESDTLAPTLPTLPPPAAPLIAHPRADRRAIVAGEVMVMLRDIACASVAAALGGRVGDRERWERASVDVVKLLDAGDVGNAHTVATQALYPAGASVVVSSVGQVRT